MESRTNTERCFGGLNCDIGHMSLYDECFKGAQYLYTIKGGPGTGKSCMMKEIAQAAIERKQKVCMIHCGSDADSLDGIYLPERRVGILDGTFPHVWEPQLPGIDGEILNIGQFWRNGKLQGEQATLRQLSAAKKKGYESVYRYFYAMRELRVEVRALLDATLDEVKLDRAARHAIDTIRGEGETSVRQMHAIGMNGDRYLSLSDEWSIIGVCDEFDGGYRYLQALHEHAKQKGIACIISYHPIYHDELQMIAFPGSGLVYTVSPELSAKRNIHMRRFHDREVYSRNRRMCRELIGMTQMLREKAILRFGDIRNIHFQIEGIYTAAMDFDAMEKFRHRVRNAVLER